METIFWRICLICFLNMLIFCYYNTHQPTIKTHPSMVVSNSQIFSPNSSTVDNNLDNKWSPDSVPVSTKDTLYHVAFSIDNITLSYSMYAKPTGKLFTTLEDAVTAVADANKTIIVSLLDLGFLDMAISLYETSLFPNKLNNYLFICVNKFACDVLGNIGLNSFLLSDDKDGKSTNAWGDRGYVRKTCMKLVAVFEILKLKYNVLLVDVDIHFFSNPLPHIDMEKELVGSMNGKPDFQENIVNTGFYFIRSTNKTLKFYSEFIKSVNDQVSSSTINIMEKGALIQDQRIFNIARQNSDMNLTKLSTDTFCNGLSHFIQNLLLGMYPEPGDSQSCIIAHYNWMVGYKQKEHLMKISGYWNADKNGYFSSEERKYITSNITTTTNVYATNFLSLASLLLLGRMLNRTVILPKFPCMESSPKQKCSYQHFYDVIEFSRYFPNQYRENVFLSHRKVPESIKKSASQVKISMKSLLDEGINYVSQFNSTRPVLNIKYVDVDNMALGGVRDIIKNGTFSVFQKLYEVYTHFSKSSF